MPKNKKIRVCLLFGGKSGEHEVSLQSAKSIYEKLDKEKYDVLLVGIDKDGQWLLGDAANYLLNEENPKLIALNKVNAKPVTAIVKQESAELISIQSGKGLGSVDVFFPITHGTYGEDGALQGFLELLDTAYVGAGVLGSAVGMDKDVMKKLFKDAGLEVGKYVAGTRKTLTSDALQTAIKELGFPIFVKPANLGSSVGISKAKNEEDLKAAMDDAFQYDTKIVLEEFIPGREIELSVLGNDEPIASIPGEVLPNHEFYSYEAKYIDENGAGLEIPAKISEDKVKEVQKLAVRAFQSLDLLGMARADFFLKSDGAFVVNEVNTLPGFTKISMYPKLWELTGIPFSELLDKLIELAIEKRAEKDKLKRTFDI
ncbi:D-alanine--D-alanine ligase [bacterium]|nr:D-alanine--D-alanine ligase [bacterium]|tara:strand:+ start:4077 stop:5189 length:1113 start_codon:yes stop_codon:yes gene_type:complete